MDRTLPRRGGGTGSGGFGEGGAAAVLAAVQAVGGQAGGRL